MNQRDPAISKGIDWSLVGIYLLLVTIGLTAIFAATYKEGDAIISSFIKFKTDYSKQFYFFGIGLVIGLFILLTDSKFFSATANLGYVIGILFLLLVFPFHSRIKGTDSIIKLGAFNFQPAEFCKIFVALALAKYLSRPETESLGKTQRHKAGPDHVLHRLTQPEIGPKREQCDDLGQTNLRALLRRGHDASLRR